MTRTLQDDELVLWEAYVTSGKWGAPDRAKLVFHCLTEPGRRARITVREGGRSDVEEELLGLTEAELLALLDQSAPLD